MQKVITTPKNKNAVIIFGDNITSFGVIRGLRDLDIDIYMVSDKGDGIGACSKFVKEVLVIHPSQPNYVEKFINWINGRFTEKPLLMIAGNDDALELLSKKHSLLCDYSIPTFPEWEVVNKVINKELINELASSIGIPVINTKRINNIEELDKLFKSDNSINYPVFLKCTNSRKFNQKYSTKGVICYSQKEILDAYTKYDGFLNSLLLQDFLPGDIDQISAVLLVLNQNSKVIAVAANEKIRAATLYSSTTLSSSMWDQNMVERAVALAEKVGYVGIVGVQFKYDPRDQEFKFLEINGRFSVSISLAQRCGINMPELVYKEFHGDISNPIEKFEQTYPDKILLWWPLSDIRILAQRRFYSRPIYFLSSLIGRGYIIEPFSLRDPKPLLMLIGTSLLKTFAKMSTYFRVSLK